MRYKIKDIGEDGVDVSVLVNDAWLAAVCPDVSVRVSDAGIRLSGRLEAVGDGYLLRGALRGGLISQCARCLEPALVPIDSTLAISFIEGEEDPESEADEDDESDGVVFFERGVIDVGIPIRDEILLVLPMSPICKPDCSGICSTCGCNRNLTPCDCEKQRLATSKLGALAKVKLQ